MSAVRRTRCSYWPIKSLKTTVRTVLFLRRRLRAKRVKPSQRHSAWRSIYTHHVLRALDPDASHLRVTARSLAERTQLQQHHCELAADRARDCAADPASDLAADRANELAADRVRDRARAQAQRQDEQDRVRQRLSSAGRWQSTGGVGVKIERENTARRRQSAGDFGRERELKRTARPWKREGAGESRSQTTEPVLHVKSLQEC